MMSGFKSSSVSFQNLGCVCLVFSATLSRVPGEEAPEGQGWGCRGRQECHTGRESKRRRGVPQNCCFTERGSYEACLEGADMTGHHSRLGSFSLGPSLEVLRME